MQSTFSVYLQLGLEHILDLKGYDHILFVVALTTVYGLRQWRHLLVLVTAFTVGHSITLALATLRLVEINSDLVEFLIPVTILITALINIGERFWDKRIPEGDVESRGSWQAKYVLALLFGLIHGLGFSNFLRAVLGGEESLFLPLFSFNVGLEIGQLVILLGTLLTGAAAVLLTGISPRNWGLSVSVVVVVLTLTMLF